MKEKNVIVLIAVLSLLGTFFLVYGAQGNYLAVIGASVFDGWATQATTSLSLTIGREQSFDVSSSGVVTFTDISFNDMLSSLTSLSNLTTGWQVNVSAYVDYPVKWDEPEPNSTQAGATKFEYFEVKVNQTVPSSSYMITFNITQANLGSVVPDNVSLLMYNDTSTLWVNLTTVVVNGVSDPALFYGITPHFSKFLIGQKVPGAGGGGGDVGGGAPGQTGTPAGGGGGGVVAKPAEKEKEPDVEEELPPKPIHIPGNYFDVNAKIPERYRELQPGDKLVAEIKILNMQRLGPMSVEVEYAIEDDGKVLWNEIETKVVENEITFIKEVELPKLAVGSYMFMVRVTFEGDVALAGYPFNVAEPERVPAARDFGFAYIAFFFIAGILLAYIVLLMRKKLLQTRRQAPKRTGVRAARRTQASDYWKEMHQFMKRR